MNRPVNKRYYAFISYRHADNKIPGRQWATWLHQAIETYEVPEELVGQANSRGETIPSRIFPIFRDEEELPADADLGNTIARALDETHLLIVLCSPNAVASTYVADEIDYFKKLGHSNRIIAALINGEPNTSWDNSKHTDEISEQDECFPLPLQFEYDDKGEPSDKRAEPIAADFRLNIDGKVGEGWTTPEALKQALKEQGHLSNQQIQEKVEDYKQQQHLMLLKVISGILGLPLGELTQRDKAYQLERERKKTRRLRQWLAGVMLLAFIAVGLGIVAYWNQKEAEKQQSIAQEQQAIAEDKERVAQQEKEKAQISQSNFLMGLAKQESDQGYYDTGLLLALNAMPGPYGGVRPEIENQFELIRATEKNLKYAELGVDTFNGFDLVEFSADGKMVLTVGNYEASVFELSSGKKLATFKHQDNISHAAFSPDGKKVATSHSNFSAALWDIEKQTLVNEFGYHSNFTPYIEFSPRGSMIATASADSTVKIWDANSLKEKFTLKHRFKLNFAHFSADEKLLLSGSGHYDNFGEAALWSTETGEKLLDLSHGNSPVVSAGFWHDKGHIVTSSANGSIIVWGLKNGKKLVQFDTERLNNISLHPDGDLIISSHQNQKAILWSIKQKRSIHEFDHDNNVTYVDFSPDGDTFVSADYDGNAYLWSLKSKKKIQSFRHPSQVNAIRFSPSGDYLASISGRTSDIDSRATIWLTRSNYQPIELDNGLFIARAGYQIQQDLNDEEEIEGSLFTLVNNTRVETWLMKSNPVTFNKLKEFQTNEKFSGVHISPSGKYVVTTSLKSGVSLWNNATGELIHQYSYKGELDFIRFSKNEDVLYLSSDYNSATGWSIESGEKLFELKHSDGAHAEFVDISKNEKIAATLSTKFGSESIIVWDLQSYTRVYSLEHPAYSNVYRATFSPDSQFLLTESSNTKIDTRAHLWSMKDGKLVKSWKHKDFVNLLLFSPDSQYLITNDRKGRDLILRNAKTGESIHDIKIPGSSYEKIEQVLFHPNGEWLLTVSRAIDKKVIVWSIAKGKPIYSLPIKEYVKTIRFSPDGSILLTAGYTNDINLWQLNAEAAFKISSFQDSYFKNVDFSEDSHQLIISSSDGTRIYPIIKDDLITKAMERLPKNRTCLTDSERLRFYLPTRMESKLGHGLSCQ